jgi:twitching motility protein PilT
MMNIKKGLILVTGPTGSGKSTTLAAMIDHINQNRKEHILTIEDPIEFVHTNKQCLVSQREVSTHTKSFAKALKAALREDPDIILVGEMRDLDTIALAITAAETGHIVFGTLHTNTAASTVDRVIDVFPPEQQAQIRVMLSESLRGVISQRLFRRIDTSGRVACHEILVNNNAIANLIREGKTFQIAGAMQTSRADGNVPYTVSVDNLVSSGKIDREEANVFLGKNKKRTESEAPNNPTVDKHSPKTTSDIQIQEKKGLFKKFSA